MTDTIIVTLLSLVGTPKVLIPDPEVIPAWMQPESTNGYSKGDKVTHNGVTYESLVDYNVWEPGVVGSETIWRVV